MNPLAHLLGDLRQLLYPREFRIGRPGWPADLSVRLAQAIEGAARAAQETAKAQQEAARRQPEPAATAELQAALQERLKFLADVGTGLWRMRRAMVPPDSGRLLDARPREEMRKPFRWLVSTWDALKESGLEIQDHTGDRYISGQALKAHFEAAPDLPEDTIIDTIKPTIYFDGRIIQMGEVVVGTPDLAAAPSSEPPAPTQPSAPPPTDPPRPSPESKGYFAT